METIFKPDFVHLFSKYPCPYPQIAVDSAPKPNIKNIYNFWSYLGEMPFGQWINLLET